MSVIIQPIELDPSHLFLLSMMTAISVHEFLANYVNEQLTIKWPNDIYWCDRKAAGILIENVWQGGEWKFAVIGIGINVNQIDFEELGARAVSLKQITGREFEPVELSNKLCKTLEEKYRLLVRESSKLVDEYKSRLYKLHKLVKLKKDNRVFDAEFKDVNNQGQMMVQHGVEEKFDVGEVEWIISDE